MAMDGLIVFVCAALVAAPPSPPADTTPARKAFVDSTLAVQMALNRGRDLLFHNDAKGAVEVLESQLARINGNRDYLTALRDAYRQYVNELVLKDQPALAEKYRQRLAILDPEAARTVGRTGAAVAAREQPRQAAPALPAVKGPTFRGKSEDRTDDPFDLSHRGKGIPDVIAGPHRLLGDRAGPPRTEGQSAADGLVGQAEAAFRQRHYDEAFLLFERANRLDPAAPLRLKGSWAYCKLNHVVEQLNADGKEPASWSALETEVRSALALAPQLEQTGKWLLGRIEERRQGKGSAAAEFPVVQVQHFPRNAQGWCVAETAHFRIFHNQSRAFAEKAAQTAEQTRAAMSRKWFGTDGDEWNPKCDLYLHADGKEYSHFTGQPASFPGHSRIETDRETHRIVARRIDVRCDNPDMLSAVLPHETTHVVLAGRFGRSEVPRWADEGMAVLTEPAAKVDLHRKNLLRCRQEGQLFPVRDLMQMTDYPRPSLVGAFYAESVSLVGFLSEERGPAVFARFLRDALQEGYEPALRKHYQYRNFEELDAAWGRKVFGGAARQTVGLNGGYR